MTIIVLLGYVVCCNRIIMAMFRRNKLCCIPCILLLVLVVVVLVVVVVLLLLSLVFPVEVISLLVGPPLSIIGPWWSLWSLWWLELNDTDDNVAKSSNRINSESINFHCIGVGVLLFDSCSSDDDDDDDVWEVPVDSILLLSLSVMWSLSLLLSLPSNTVVVVVFDDGTLSRVLSFSFRGVGVELMDVPFI